MYGRLVEYNVAISNLIVIGLKKVSVRTDLEPALGSRAKKLLIIKRANACILETHPDRQRVHTVTLNMYVCALTSELSAQEQVPQVHRVFIVRNGGVVHVGDDALQALGDMAEALAARYQHVVQYWQVLLAGKLVRLPPLLVRYPCALGVDSNPERAWVVPTQHEEGARARLNVEEAR